MSGHSKWSTIKRKKGALDAKRGKIFTTLIKEITIAARLGGGDENANPRLRQAIAKAKANNMPQDNIKRAIMKGTGELPGVSYEEATFEGYGPGGVAIYMEVLTDNHRRTVAELRHLMSKYGGNLGENGSVAWMFDKKGQIILDKSAGDEESLFEVALDCGAEDFEVEEEEYIITTEPGQLMEVKEALEAREIPVRSAELEMVPKNTQKVEGKEAERLLKLMDALEDNDDINHVYANFDIDDETLASAAES
ncbi:MAG: YebC/PmpR family DNA-binding transcriptional regulator [Candidatus Neomarinimicrobiota bacterium]|nr:MAG: YebC/PmpR family DNA-binding transcriptional regulator [Candidatus Neomarinimicrobiota bacterium]